MTLRFKASQYSCASRRRTRSPFAAHQLRLTDDAQHGLAVGERDLADGKPLRLFHEHRGQTGRRHLPHLHRNADRARIFRARPAAWRDSGRRCSTGGSRAPSQPPAEKPRPRRADFFSSGSPRISVPFTASLTDSIIVLLNPYFCREPRGRPACCYTAPVIDSSKKKERSKSASPHK